jgi:hypothetical protein
MSTYEERYNVPEDIMLAARKVRRFAESTGAKNWQINGCYSAPSAPLAAATDNSKQALTEALRFIVNRENLMFAECSDAEEIIAVAKAALASQVAPLSEDRVREIFDGFRSNHFSSDDVAKRFARAIEAAHGIKERKNEI